MSDEKINFWQFPRMGKLCILSEFFFGVCYTAWTFSLNFHFSACGVSETNIGILMAVGYLITAAFSFFAGRLGDRKGYPFVMACGMIAMSTALALLSMTEQLAPLCLIHGLYCAGLACYMSMEFTQPLSLLQEEQRQYGYNTVLMFYFLGSIAGNLLCSALLPLIPDRQNPYRWILLMCSGIYLLMALVKFRMPRQKAAPAADREDGQLKVFLSRRQIWSYLLFGFFTLGLFTLATGMLNLVLRLWRGMTDGQVVNVFFANSLAGCAVICILPRLTQRFSLHRISCVTMAVQCLALTAMPVLGNGPFVGMILLRTACCNILYAAVDSPMLESVPAHMRGTYSGVRIFSNHIGVALASVTAGWLVDDGRFVLLYLLCGGIALCQNLTYHLLCVPYLLPPGERKFCRRNSSETGIGAQVIDQYNFTDKEKTDMKKVILNGVDLSIEDVVKVARNGYGVEIDAGCMRRIAEVRDYMEREWMREDAPAVYGFNTGLGKHKDCKVSIEESDLHQYRTVLSHCGGVGEAAPEEVVRAAMCVRLNAFCRGVSGLRPVVVERLAELLNKGVHPVVPWQGSVGACGDLAPMAHIVSVLIGVPQAEAFYQGERMPAREALKKAGIAPVEFQLKAKDCLALLNGTTMFAGMACLNVHDAERLYKVSEITTALSLEAVRGETRAFDPRIQSVRPYEGQMKAAANVLRLVEGSERVTEDARKVHLDYDVMHPHYQERVQDVYSLRCMPQVQGVCRENLSYIKHLITVEINAATDNPLIFPKGDGHYEFLSGGNFHGEPTGFAMDLLTMSLAEIGNIADRRCFSLCDPTLSYGLPLALASEPIGLNYGYNIICCSTSALASENKTLCFPSVCDNIPTKANQEDHVSMAPWAARKCQLAIRNLEKILGIELLLACRGIFITGEKLGRFKLGKGTAIAYKLLTDKIQFNAEADTYMRDQSKAAIGLVESDELLHAVEAAVGEL